MYCTIGSIPVRVAFNNIISLRRRGPSKPRRRKRALINALPAFHPVPFKPKASMLVVAGVWMQAATSRWPPFDHLLSGFMAEAAFSFISFSSILLCDVCLTSIVIRESCSGAKREKSAGGCSG